MENFILIIFDSVSLFGVIVCNNTDCGPIMLLDCTVLCVTIVWLLAILVFHTYSTVCAFYNFYESHNEPHSYKLTEGKPLENICPDKIILVFLIYSL